MTAEPIDENAVLKWGGAPISGVSVTSHVAVSFQITHAMDYVVMLQILYNLASGIPASPVQVWGQLQDREIRSVKDAKRLVGKNAVYESFNRLIDAGFVRRTRLPHPDRPGQKGPVNYEVFDNPAWNPDWAPPRGDSRNAGLLPNGNPQVAPRSGTPDVVNGEVEEAAGQATSRNQGSGNATSGVPGSGGRRVPAGQNASGVPGSVRPSPPHPPEEEVGTTSPSIPKHAATPRRGKTSSNDDTLDPARRDKAIKFLMNLPGAWAVGLTRARGLAGKLIANADATGWDLDTALRLYLTRHEPDKGAVKNHGATLAYRISDMQSKDAVLAAAAEASEPAGQAAGAAPSKPGHVDWCGECDSPTYRFLVPDDGPASKCKTCHPAYAATRA